MKEIVQTETDALRGELGKLLTTLKHNREKVPLATPNSKYKKRYDTLCADIRRYATDYSRHLRFCGIRIHKNYLKEAVPSSTRQSNSPAS